MKGRKPELRSDPDAITANIEPPTWLVSKHAREEWVRVFPILTARRILTNADLGCLESYCVAIARVRELEIGLQVSRKRELEELKANPPSQHLMKLAEMLVVTTIDPKIFRMQDQAIKTARQLAAELGLTPVSRSRPSVREDSYEDEDDDNPLAVV